MKSKMLSLQGLRFLFALGVFFLHLPYPAGIDNFCPYGYIGVTFFFILSGFLSASSDTSDIKEYYIKKFWRIFPIHWFAFVCMAIALIPTHSYWTFDTIWIALSNVLLLQCYYPDANVCYSFNGPSWFLCALLLFYILLPWLQRLRKKNRMGFYVLTIISLLISVLISRTTMNQEWAIKEWGRTNFPFVRLHECLLGICLYDMRKEIYKIINVWEISALLFFVISLLLVRFIPPFYTQIYWWLPIMMYVIYVFSNKEGGYLSKVLSSNFFVYMGNISMEIYMFHSIAIRLVPSIEFFFVAFPFWIDVLLVMILTTIMVFVYKKLIEKQINNLRA